MTLALRYAVRSDVGLLREGNEDSAYAGPSLLAVADGMGGHAAGEVASAVTIGAMAELDSLKTAAGDMMAALSGAVAAANMRLQQMIIANPAVEGMGTTLTAVLWSDGHAAVCHIGDSRGYLLRSGELYQITHDHTLVQSLVDEGRITEDDVSTHPQRSLLLRALDGRTVAEPDLSAHESLAGDRYLLCSDGLSGVVSDETLREMLATIADPEAATRQLIDLAIRGGGPDNITCIVADVVDTSASRGPLPSKPVMAGAAVNGTNPLQSPPGTNPFAAIGKGGKAGPRPRTGRGSTAPQQVMDDGGGLTRAHAIPVPQNGYQDSYGEGYANGGPGQGGHGQDATAGSGDLADGGFGESGLGRAGRARRSHRAKRRRWPIVKISLGVLVAALVAGGYIAYRYTQDQYYVALNSDQVVIYQGVNQSVLGVSLSHPYQRTGVQEGQLPSDVKALLSSIPTASDLPAAEQIVSNARDKVSNCMAAYSALATWQTQNTTYQHDLATARKAKRSTKDIKGPGPQPAMPPGTCPASTAFGIPMSALPAIP